MHSQDGTSKDILKCENACPLYNSKSVCLSILDTVSEVIDV